MKVLTESFFQGIFIYFKKITNRYYLKGLHVCFAIIQLQS
jgi:hypothetical protein